LKTKVLRKTWFEKKERRWEVKSLLLLLLLLLLIIFCTPGFIPLQVYPSTVPYPIPLPHIPVSKRMSSTSPTRPLNSLRPPISTKLRPGSPLLYMCCRLYISCYMLPGWWFSVREILGVLVNWNCWSFYRVTLLLSFFQLSPETVTGPSSFCPLIGCKYLHLTLSGACGVFWRAVMIGPFLWALHSLSNSVRSWDLPMNWTPLWACHSTFFSSGSSPFPCL
jgi:hypothetical protein